MPELLSPAGSYESLIAAVNAGADAVYMGGSRFGARAFADNPDTGRFIEGLHYAHRYGRKVYMTVNTLMKPSELEELADYIRPYYEEGLDAVLVQDLGAMKLLSEEYPQLPLHASTQMTITNHEGAAFLKQYGVTRVVPARELSLRELKKIKDEAGIEVEAFVHGALCYSYSGQCLMSSMIGGRSGNRGRCAQSCRLEYGASIDGCSRHGQLLSLKDLCALRILPQIIAAGIDSLKIEGRMKSPRYTAGVTSIWRKYLDLFEEKGTAGYRVAEKDMRMLADLFDRGGRTEGYFFQHNGPDMMAWDERKDRRNQEELYAYLDDEYVNTVLKLPVDAEAVFREGEKASLTVSTGDNRVCAEGPVCMKAEKRPLTEEDIRKQLLKTGGTAFEIRSLRIEADGGIFLPLGRINEMRRDALSALEEVIQSGYQRAL